MKPWEIEMLHGEVTFPELTSHCCKWPVFYWNGEYGCMQCLTALKSDGSLPAYTRQVIIPMEKLKRHWMYHTSKEITFEERTIK